MVHLVMCYPKKKNWKLKLNIRTTLGVDLKWFLVFLRISIIIVIIIIIGS